MALVNISGGSVLIDDEYLWLFENYSWFISDGRVKGYAELKYDKQEKLAHYVAGYPLRGWENEHINGDPLDNRRSNLEQTTHKENVLRWAATTKGYYWDSSRGKWAVSLTINYKRVNGGRFDREEDAARRAQQLRDERHRI